MVRLYRSLVLLVPSCRACVEASIACGWCVYNRICTGNASICRHEEDWRSIQEVSERISRDLWLKKNILCRMKAV